MQYCAECGKEMAKTDYGAHLKCCNGLGYWAAVSPSDGYDTVIPRVGKYWLYIDYAKCPKGKKAKRPDSM